jgi:hypothetical protein
MVLPEYTPAMQPKNNTPRDELIVRYFRQGYTNKEISQVLPDIVEAMLKIMENSGQCLGYRRVWKRLTTEYGSIFSERVQNVKIIIVHSMQNI